jgi:hypothetical protein
VANHLKTTKSKGLLRQMPGVGAARIVPSTSTSELSAFTQAGAYPGIPELDSLTSSLFLKATGTIPEDETPIKVETLRGGMVGFTEGQWTWTQAIDADLRPVLNTGTGKGSIDDVRGWEWPSYATYYEGLVVAESPDVEQFDAVTTSDGRIWQAYRIFDTGVSCSVIVTVRDLDRTWTDVTVYENTDTTRTLFCPCLVVMPDDRVLVYLLNYTPGATSYQIQALVIDPVLLTVDDYEVACMKSALTTSAYGTPTSQTQVRGAMKPDGSVMLVLSTDDGDNYSHILQLGSYDYGHSFSVTSYGSTPDEDYLYPDVVYTQGIFVVSYVRAIVGELGVDIVVIKSLSHYFDSLYDAPVLETYIEKADGGTDSTVLGNALVATPDGVLYGVNTVANDDTQEVYGHCHVSLDLGASWEDSGGNDKPNVGYDSGSIGPSWLYFSIATAQETVAQPGKLCATYQGNRVYVGLGFVKDSQSADDFDDGSLVAFYLGGYSNQQKSFIDSLAKTSDGQISYKTTFFPFVDPEYNGWTLTTAGSHGAAIVGSYYVITTADGGKHYYSKTGGTSVASVSVEFDFSAGATFGTMTQGDVGVELQVDSGTLKYRLGVYFLATSGVQGGLRLRDLVSNTTIADLPIDWTDEYSYKVELYNGKFQLFYRPTSSSEDQVWERAKDPFDEDGVYTGYTLTSTASTGASASVVWGHLFATTTGSTGDAVTRWRRVLCNFGSNLATSAAASGIKYWFISSYIDYASTDDFHNGYPFVAAPVWIRDGVYVIASGGPTYLHDEWTIRPAYQYPVENIMPEHAPSPLKEWRSDNDDAEVVITWLVGDGDIDAALADVEREWPGNETLAAFIMGSNFKTAALYGVDSANAEQKILDIVMTRWSSLIYQTHGDTLIVASGGGTNYVGYGELAGHYAMMSGKSLPRLITGNYEGQLNTSTKTATVRFESLGDETQGVDNDSGNLIFGSSGFFVCHDPPAAQFKAYKLKIPAQATAEGYFKIAKFMFGPLLVIGRDPSYGFTTELPQDNTLRNKTTAGHTETRVYNRPFRIKQLSWEDGIDQTSLDAATPDYIQFASPADEPAGLYHDTARQLYGFFSELNGADELVVWCDFVPLVSNTGELRPERYLYGRLTSSFQESNVLGYEGVNEMVQVTNLVLEEER